MKIIFLCGSLEPGKDGVGDYTCRLASELVRQGHQAGIIALRDKYVHSALNGIRVAEGINLPELRLPDAWPSSEIFKKAAEWIQFFDPEWLSLQFVPFSFHPKGLPLGFINLISKLGNGRKWHIMVHELWVGMNIEAPRKLAAWGWVQKKVIQNLLWRLNPKVIHTQTKLYQAQLQKLGFSAAYLPLFSNIPVHTEYRTRNLQTATTNLNKQSLSLVIFGTIHPGAPVRDFAKETALYAQKNDVEPQLLFIGRCGSELEHWENVWKAEGLKAKTFGEQSPEYIYTVLEEADFGISTTPAALAEKSGTVAAMRDHGLSVLCVRNTWQPRGILLPENLPGITSYTKGNLETFFRCKSKKSGTSLVLVGQGFYNALLNAP
jgi:hypothetical protein